MIALCARTPHWLCLTVRAGQAHITPGAVSQGAIGTLASAASLSELPQSRTGIKGTFANRINICFYTYCVASRIRLLGFCLAISGAAVLLRAQTAELSGFVKDQSESSIPDARLELRSQEKGTRVRTTSNKDGLYSFVGLRPGIYDVTVQADGFRTLTRDGVLLNVGDRVGLDFSLQLSGVSSSITVSAGPTTRAGAPTPEGAAVGTLVDQEFVSNMPLNGRSFQSLIHLSPGVVVTRSTGAAPGQFIVNGQRNNANYIMVDGVSANFAASPYRWWGQSASGAIPAFDVLGGTNGIVSVDAMQEFHIQTSSIAPEYGRTPGAQISIITRSGSNAIHGSGFEYVRNDVFDARNWFNVVPQPKPPLRQNDSGATLGGPIRKNRTFGFNSYEGLRLQEPKSGSANVLTVEARAKAAPVFQALVNAFPIPNGPANPDGFTAQLTGAFSDPSRLDATSLRIDHQVTDRVTVFGRYSHAPSSQGARAFSQLKTDSSFLDMVTGGATILFTPRVVNDFRANWSRALAREDYSIESTWGAIAPPDSALFGDTRNPNSSGAAFSVGYTSSVRVPEHDGRTPSTGPEVRGYHARPPHQPPACPERSTRFATAGRSTTSEPAILLCRIGIEPN